MMYRLDSIILCKVDNMYAWSMIGQVIPPLYEAPLKDCCGGIVDMAPFGRVKDVLSAGASSMII